MATSISTAAATVTGRLILGVTAQEPTSAELQTWLRDGFKHLLGVLPPVVKGTFPVVSGTEWHTVSLPNDGVWAVMHGTDYLIQGAEYGVTPTGITLDRGVGAIPDEYVTVYYTKYPLITDSTTSIESTCEFGPDWLAEPAMRYTIARSYERLAGTAPSQDGEVYAGRYRMAEESYTAAVQACYARWEEFQKGLKDAISLRLSPFGHRPFVQHPASGFVNKSQIVNRLFP
jgi:hypothetical protein